MEYLPRPMSINQAKHLIKFLTLVYDLDLMSEETFAGTSYHFDDCEWRNFSWEPPDVGLFV